MRETCRSASDDRIIDYDKMTEFLWTDEYLTREDRLYRFMNDRSIRDFNEAVDLAQGTPNVSALGRDFTRAMYSEREKRGELQYPDANSTMRLTWGKVSTFLRDGAPMPTQTFSGEILAKERPDVYDFSLKSEWKQLLQDARDIPVNFITDNDITGGNSGSPVLNGEGDIIGLAFDGNKESLASDVRWVEGWCKCVCVDIRFVLWTLEHYAGLTRILEEIETI